MYVWQPLTSVDFARASNLASKRRPALLARGACPRHLCPCMVTVNLSRLVGAHVRMVTVYLSGLGTVLARITCGRPCIRTVNLNIFLPTVNLNTF